MLVQVAGKVVDNEARLLISLRAALLQFNLVRSFRL